MPLTHYPQALSDVVPGLRLLCNDARSLRQLAYSKPLHAIVTSTFTNNDQNICELQFVTREKGDYITQHHYLYYLKNGYVYFEQITALYDLLVVTRANPIVLISS